ncbi:MAG: recombinase family protein [Gemmataceae bacterium]|nr:recombinase family protein [Gemmataceae bacterium]
MREAISFGRFSSKPQERGDSVSRQEAAYNRVCERYKDRCTPSVRYGFGQFFGTGESGFHGRHLRKGGSLHAFFDKVRGGDIDPRSVCLVVEAFDRLSRIEPDLAMQLLSDIVRSGCPVAVDSPDMWIERADLGGPKFILIAAMMQLAHAESAQKSVRVKASWESRKALREERPVTTVCPRWCRFSEGRFVLIPKKAGLVARIFQMYIGGHGGQTIARTLNDEKIPILGGKTGRVWDQEAVRFILKARTTIGEYQPMEFAEVQGKRKRVRSGAAVPGYYPAAVTEELFYRAQACLAERRRSQGRNTHSGTNLFRGILHDARTRSTMNVKVQRAKGIDYKYLVPSRAVKDGQGWTSIAYDLVEAGFLAFVKELRVDPPAESGNSAEIEKEENLIGELQGRLDRLNAEEDLDVLIPLVRKTTEMKRQAEARLEALRRENHALTAGDSLDDFATFTRLHQQHEDAGTLAEFNEVLRNKVRGLVSEMWMLIQAKNKRTKTVVVQVFLKSGAKRWFVVRTTGKGGGFLSCDPSPYVDPETDLRFLQD